MPLYVYRCEECGDEFTIVHSMGYDLQKKEGCNKICTLKRIPQAVQNNKKSATKQKPGKLVNQYIKEVKKELKEEKEHLKQEIKI